VRETPCARFRYAKQQSALNRFGLDSGGSLSARSFSFPKPGTRRPRRIERCRHASSVASAKWSGRLWRDLRTDWAMPPYPPKEPSAAERRKSAYQNELGRCLWQVRAQAMVRKASWMSARRS
jgi:hypothetical protein